MLSGICRRHLSLSVTLHGGPVEFRPIRATACYYYTTVNWLIHVRYVLVMSLYKDERITRTVARTFAPEFASHVDFPCPLLWTEPGSDALSLAEILETAEVRFEIWHQVPGSSYGNWRILHVVLLFYGYRLGWVSLVFCESGWRKFEANGWLRFMPWHCW